MGADFLSVPDPSSLGATEQSDRDQKEQFLRFYLVPNTKAMISISQLTEVVTIPFGQIVPIPHLPAWVMGVYNWRGEILWMVDLGQLIGLTPWYQQGGNPINYKAVVVRSYIERNKTPDSGSKTLGLVVSKVEDIEWCNPAGIKSPPSSGITQEIAPFLRGYWLKSSGEIVLVLDGDAIMAAMPYELNKF